MSIDLLIGLSEGVKANMLENGESIDEIIPIISKSKFKFEANDVEVKESKNKGNGLFVKKDFRKDELITLYPIDVISDVDDLNAEHFVNYKYYKNKRTVISADPEKRENLYLGHFCNDGCIYDTNNTNVKCDDLYDKISKLKANAEIYLINNVFLAVMSTKEIKDGDEVFIHYGIPRWKLIKN